ncbi:hypothetical protein N825_10315 [Skermanella stibiiresistens SB22]|uniref:Transposase (putative) YhgA-like domain-containing protein n=1 Tax=Skermanella stibiiresistens SB22 TaxID=1385369 RepID=W9GYE5_9PROT|nr:Rpn family recombination-promoting nuclease/putative transposase [Skermanella stibiiresistens]EWY38955.1 hypothetical protein N825_10315 [Skermanella stibiiresistens SB22]
MPRSDSVYHRLFSHPLMIEQLIREFVSEEVAAGLDFGRMERVNAKFHSPGGRRREGDVIWRVATNSGEVVHIYLMLEFQSRTDWWMLVRVQVYIGLLWQQIIEERKLPSGSRLPPVLPIVPYNGDRPWTSPTDSAGLNAVAPSSPLWSWQPNIRYHLIDEAAFKAEDLAESDSLVALLFRVENCTQRDELPRLIGRLVDWFKQHAGNEALMRLFGEVVSQAAVSIVGVGDVTTQYNDLTEVQNMLATRFKEWETQLRAEGLTKGRAEMLSRQLERRFGRLPAEADSMIASATAEQLDVYMDRLMEAGSLSDVFQDVQAG